jgi:hypothetical protein
MIVDIEGHQIYRLKLQLVVINILSIGVDVRH